MSNIYIIKKYLKELMLLNDIRYKEIKCSQKEVVEERKYKKSVIFNFSIFFYENKVLLDDFFVIYFFFVKKYKIYRCYIDFINSSFNFILKKRNMNALKEVI